MVTKTQTTNVNTITAPESTPEATGSIRQASSLFTMIEQADGNNVQSKVAFMGDIRQRLAQVADEASQNGEQAQETERLADTSATRLYRARISGIISGEELNGLLVDVFGAKPKQDGTPGKTPAGAGETIRKRIVRAVQGYDFVNGGDGGRFFEAMDKDDVASVINAIGRTKKVTAGDPPETVEVPDGPSIWTAYKMLGDIKSQGVVRVDFAFDPKKIVGLTEKLSESGARDKFISNPSLLKAYKGLFDQLQVLASVDESEVASVAARLGVATGNEPTADEAEGEQMAA